MLLAGMLPEMTAFVEALLPVNSALAARCIGESGGVPPGESTVAKVQGMLAAIAISLTAPVEKRNAAGNALNYVGDPRPGVGVKGRFARHCLARASAGGRRIPEG